MKFQPTRQQAADTFNRFIKFCALDTSLNFAIQGGEEMALRTSLRKVREEYGSACSQIFELLFIKHQRGGRSLVTGRGYATMWCIDERAASAFLEAMQETKNIIHQTAKDVLDVMKSKGIGPKERLKTWKQNTNTWEIESAEIYEGDELKRQKALRREINAERRYSFSQQKANAST